jgi:hypothetical protein
MYSGTNVEHDQYDYTINNCSHENSNKCLKEMFESHTGKHSTSHTIRKVPLCET